MAMHTQSLQQEERASLLFTQPDVSGDSLGAARLTILGVTKQDARRRGSRLYLSRYESAKYWQNYTDFAYYSLAVSGRVLHREGLA
jgi:hypothetical protein